MGWPWTSTKDSSTQPTSSSTTTSPQPPPLTSPTSSTTDERAELDPPSTSPPTRLSPYPHLPTTLSCRTSFDAAFYCQSLGGQFVNIYRYGTLRSCSEHWSDFWFCVRTNRGRGGELKGEAIKEWARGKERQKYSGGVGDEMKGSSEDVWQKRRWAVRGAFEGDWGDLERDRAKGDEELHGDEEFQREMR